MSDNITMMRKRLGYQGGIRQEDRMIKSKWITLQRAFKYSYQACTVQMVQPHNTTLDLSSDQIDPEMSVFPLARALINPDKVKQDYDDKIISINYQDNFGPGDVFEWKRTGTFWIIYTQEITEDAYFRGEIRRCRYQIKFKDEQGNVHSTWAAIRGPVETQIDSIQKNQVRIDRPNMSLNILMPLNDITRQAFDRYKEFLLDGKCWRVHTTNSISMKNVLEINAGEYYIDRDTDDVEEEIKNGLVIEPIDPTPQSIIKGETFIKPQIAETYSAPEAGGAWKVLECNYPVKMDIISGTSISLIWQKSTSGQFTLQWSKGSTVDTKTIVVESLF